MTERLLIVEAKDPKYAESAKVMQLLLDNWLKDDKIRDMFGIPRVGREPDYLNGRWCIRCHNSLPGDWGLKPCDVCGYRSYSGNPLSGVLANDPENTAIYKGVPRA